MVCSFRKEAWVWPWSNEANPAPHPILTRSSPKRTTRVLRVKDVLPVLSAWSFHKWRWSRADPSQPRRFRPSLSSISGCTRRATRGAFDARGVSECSNLIEHWRYLTDLQEVDTAQRARRSNMSLWIQNWCSFTKIVSRPQCLTLDLFPDCSLDWTCIYNSVTDHAKMTARKLKALSTASLDLVCSFGAVGFR